MMVTGHLGAVFRSGVRALAGWQRVLLGMGGPLHLVLWLEPSPACCCRRLLLLLLLLLWCRAARPGGNA